MLKGSVGIIVLVFIVASCAQGPQFYLVEANFDTFETNLYVSVLSPTGQIKDRKPLGSTIGCAHGCSPVQMRPGPNYSIVVSDVDAWTISPSLNTSNIYWELDFEDWVYMNGVPVILTARGNPDIGSYALQAMDINTGHFNLLCNYTFPETQAFYLPPIALGKNQEVLALLEGVTGKVVTQFVKWRTDTCSLTRIDLVGNGVVTDFLVDIVYSTAQDKLFSVDMQGNVYEFDPTLFTARNVSRGEFAGPVGNLVMDQEAEVLYFLMNTEPVSLGMFDLNTGKSNKIPITGALYSIVNLAIII